MKLTLFLLATVAVAHVSAKASMKSVQESMVYLKAISDCKKEEHPIEGDLRAIKENDVEKLSPSGKCFVGCAFEKLGVLQNGNFSRANAEKLVRRRLGSDAEKIQVALTYLNTCEKALTGASSDKCTTGPILLTCVEEFKSEVQME